MCFILRQMVKFVFFKKPVTGEAIATPLLSRRRAVEAGRQEAGVRD